MVDLKGDLALSAVFAGFALGVLAFLIWSSGCCYFGW